jgi:RNA polymerase sigma factor FliA
LPAKQSSSEQRAELAHAWQQFKQYGSQPHRDFLIEHHRYLVPKTRQRIVPTVPGKIQPEDLEMEGYIALIRAVDQFDPERRVEFKSYAISMIRGAMLEFLRKEDWVPRSVRTKQKRIQSAEQALALEVGPQNITDEARAQKLELELDSFYQLFFEATVMQVVSMDDVIGDSDSDDLDPLLVLESVKSSDPDPHLAIIVKKQKETLEECVSWLPGNERDVVVLYYYQGKTLKEIARHMGRSESRAHQLHAQAILRLAGYMRTQRELFRQHSQSTSDGRRAA